MKDETDWKACPFCGGHVIVSRNLELTDISGIMCTRCKAMVKFNIPMKPHETFGSNEEKWKTKWNRRAHGSDR